MTMYRFTIKQTAQSQEIRNVYYFDLAAETSAVKQSVVDGLSNAFKNNAQASFGTSFLLYGVDVQRADTEGYPSEPFVPTGGSWAGTGVGNELANQTALLIAFTALTQPPNRVRKYIGCQLQGALTAGKWTSAHLTVFGTVAAAIIALDGLTDVQGPYSVRYSLGDPSTILASNKVTQYAVRDIPATQRRRRIGVGI